MVTLPRAARTLRIQTREDGVQIDQVVLSAATYLTVAPGPVASDTTIVPRTTIPSPWTTQTVGANSIPGSASFANSTFTVAGSGADIWGAADAFQFVSQTTSGDTQIVARVATLQNTNPYAKAGVMLRADGSAGASTVLLDVRPDGEVEFMSRAASGAAMAYLAGGTQTMPAWLKLTRSGATVSASISANGTAWTLVGSTSVVMPASALLGLAVTSHDVTQLNAATFDSVAIALPPAAPAAPAPTSGVGGVATNAALT